MTGHKHAVLLSKVQEESEALTAAFRAVAVRHGNAGSADRDAERACRQFARRLARVESEKIREASLRRRSRPSPGPLSEEFAVKIVVLAAAEMGIGRMRVSEESAVALAADTVLTDLTRPERRAVEILTGARKRRQSRVESQAQRIACHVTEDWDPEPKPVGRPKGAGVAALQADDGGWQVPTPTIDKRVNVAMECIEEMTGRDRRALFEASVSPKTSRFKKGPLFEAIVAALGYRWTKPPTPEAIVKAIRRAVA